MIDAKPDKQAPREFLLTKLKGAVHVQGRADHHRRQRGLHDRHAHRFADRQRPGPGALGGHLSRPERVHLRGREPLGARRRARGRRPHQVDGTDIARPQAVGISARRAVSHQSREGHRQDASCPTTRQTCPRTSSRRKLSSSSTRCIRTKQPKAGPAVQDRRVTIRDVARSARRRCLDSMRGPCKARRVVRACDVMADKKLELIDTATGKKAVLPVRSGTVGPSVVDIAPLAKEFGAFTYDPGLRRNRRGREQDHLHRRRCRRAHAPRLSDRAARRRRARSSKSAIYC